jgi:hypothetical protein
MQAIRQSPDPTRTMDAFWRGQIISKEWLIENLSKFVKKRSNIDIHGGWVGVLASMLFQSGIPINKIQSVDIDPSCQPIASMMNKLEEMAGRFKSVTADMCSFRSASDVIINTSCEHITQDQYNQWLSGLPSTSLLVLQSNNYLIDEHVRTASSLEEFASQSKINIKWQGKLELPLYTRWMIIGYNV